MKFKKLVHPKLEVWVKIKYPGSKRIKRYCFAHYNKILEEDPPPTPLPVLEQMFVISPRMWNSLALTLVPRIEVTASHMCQIIEFWIAIYLSNKQLIELFDLSSTQWYYLHQHQLEDGWASIRELQVLCIDKFPRYHLAEKRALRKEIARDHSKFLLKQKTKAYLK